MIMKKYNICFTDENYLEILKEKNVLGKISTDSIEILDELNKLNIENESLKYAFENTMEKTLDFFKNNSKVEQIIREIENIYYKELKEG